MSFIFGAAICYKAFLSSIFSMLEIQKAGWFISKDFNGISLLDIITVSAFIRMQIYELQPAKALNFNSNKATSTRMSFFMLAQKKMFHRKIKLCNICRWRYHRSGRISLFIR